MCQTEHGCPTYMSATYFTLLIGNSLDNSAFQEFVKKKLDERPKKLLISIKKPDHGDRLGICWNI